MTFVHVTHSQEEAMALADQVVVMNHGRIEQDGSPHEMFNAPRQRVRRALHGRPQRDSADAAGWSRCAPTRRA